MASSASAHLRNGGKLPLLLVGKYGEKNRNVAAQQQEPGYRARRLEASGSQQKCEDRNDREQPVCADICRLWQAAGENEIFAQTCR
jgi:hypothetical protein